jgi:hypothetical protein
MLARRHYAAGNLLRLARAAERNAPAYRNQRTRPVVNPVMSRCSPSGMNKPTAHRQKFAQLSHLTPGCEVLLSWQVFIVTIILILLCASASAGLAIGLLLFRVEAVVLASLFLALLCAALLPYHGFGLGGDVQGGLRRYAGRSCAARRCARNSANESKCVG